MALASYQRRSQPAAALMAWRKASTLAKSMAAHIGGEIKAIMAKAES